MSPLPGGRATPASAGAADWSLKWRQGPGAGVTPGVRGGTPGGLLHPPGLSCCSSSSKNPISASSAHRNCPVLIELRRFVFSPEPQNRHFVGASAWDGGWAFKVVCLVRWSRLRDPAFVYKGRVLGGKQTRSGVSCLIPGIAS